MITLMKNSIIIDLSNYSLVIYRLNFIDLNKIVKIIKKEKTEYRVS